MQNKNTAQRGRGPRPNTNSSPNAENLNPNQMLSKPKEIPASQQRPRPSSTSDEDPAQRKGKGRPVRNDNKVVNERGDSLAAQRKPEGVGHDGRNSSGNQQKVAEEEEVENKEVVTEELDEKEGLSRELTKLERFQEEQKKMESDNAKRKALLSMAIADRKKKTQAEAKRLAYIQKELAKIEDLLTNDVRILRDRIEEASRTYLEAQKRYQKAEEEFVAAKMQLHKAEDTKEALTEHLCTIIHENEIRKSQKLEELVNKLEVGNLDEFEKQLHEEAQVPQSPTKQTVLKTDDTNKINQNGPSVVIATNQAASEKSSPETSGTSTDKLQNSPMTEKTVESQTVEGAVNQAIEGDINVESNKGAKQESAAVIPTSGGNQDSNPNPDQKMEENKGVGSDVTEPPSVS
ncbi:uncharacterized protein [Amphiura filiformis]|uniref:uncharacterized protein n=1 Tax=Amphiura filiformis TaxID=82378 RepID=UPI003B226D51